MDSQSDANSCNGKAGARAWGGRAREGARESGVGGVEGEGVEGEWWGITGGGREERWK